ncbi:MAG: LacI family transcriptional regulator [Chlorobi bacterium]|uniref:LacI family DNA-binding transcriptional regulator n=2 Tax=Chryseobacterium TaxID=59732 RepID=A0AAJ1R8R3_9FLAO|nr:MULTISPECIES: LacI family DNA-binding transcriptional regulator [Chryseobacterium]NPA08601.1 LacI family transcriptional regulator [Chlorobiota bacterium]MCF2221430.1 LacI family transcriptional regulator [Chryseobacterium sp. PS-8]MDN4015085.1 LacI family DNA-binding transcriptional regulator [Chryseobacterium gambrini]MDN4028609.1 LacI family DNA-binding transcriptional regulator [Chryseobacterium gambrini]QWA37816.1 LacI family transcriptional regulator [Chryseobacterium sp. ZHDP1]
MNKKNATIYDISKKLNVSVATVSRALNDHPRISEATKELVRKTAKEMNYKQNNLAKALKSGETKNVGIIVPFVNTNFFSSVIRGIEEELSPFGYHVIICQSHEDVNIEKRQLNTLLNAQVDGIFISVSKTTVNTEHIQSILDTSNTPIIFFDRKKDISGISTVTIDDYRGGYLATEHLIKEGYKNICHFAGDLNLEIYQNRLNGYKQALTDHDFKVKEENIVITESSVDAGIDAIKKLWDRKSVPDAIFSSSDFAALGACQELKKRNIKIPQEVAVIGFSNEPFTQFMELPISSVDQTPVMMGKMAGQVFIESVKENSFGVSIEKKVVLAPQLHIRKSSKRK